MTMMPQAENQATFTGQPLQGRIVRAPRKVQGLSFLVQGPPKAGKSTIGDSGPRPRLIVDVEGSSYWTPSEKVYWNPRMEPPPQPGQKMTAGYGPVSYTPAWETAVVLVREAQDIYETYRVLNSGRHPFNSGCMDSVTEMQQRLIDDMVGIKQMKLDQWGAILRQLSSMTRQWRDLITHPVKPLWSMTFVAGTKFDRDMGKWRPLVQGQVGDFLPYYVDVLGYLSAYPDNRRFLFIGPHPNYETGERIGGRLPDVMQLAYPSRMTGYTVESMLTQALAGRW